VYVPMKLSISAAFSISTFIVYSEYDYVFVYSKLGINKFKSEHIYMIVHSATICLCYNMFVTKLVSDSLALCCSYIQDCFRSTRFGFFAKYRMKGLGHRIFVRKNNFLFKLGYSHFIYKLLDLDLKHNKKRNKKKPFFAIRGMSLVNVRNAVFTIQSYRLPNCYDKNGI
jgi:ribosomal protein L6P/L9E